MSSLIPLMAILAATASLVLAGPGGFVTLINATPYHWKLVNQHSYHIDWHPEDFIEAGSSSIQYFEYWYDHHDVGDDAAEAVYAIIGAPTRQHFTLKAVQDGEKHFGKKIQIQYHDNLESLGNGQNSLINLGFTHNGMIAFALAGNGDGPYISTNSPSETWMQDTYDIISRKTLREVSLPASHNAGLSELTWRWAGNAHNTQTQAVHIYSQLKLGVRVFDIRPAYYYGYFFTGHFSTIGWDGRHIGATGRTIRNVVKDINNFCDEYPGELIILDISHDMNVDDWWYPLSTQRWEDFYILLADIKDLWIPSESDRRGDITRLPLSSFIQKGGRCSVVVRIENDVVQPGERLEETNHPKREIKSQGIGVADRGGRKRPVDGEPGDVPSGDPEEIPPLDTVNGFGNYPEDEWRAAVEATLSVTQTFNDTSSSTTNTASTDNETDPDTTSSAFPTVTRPANDANPLPNTSTQDINIIHKVEFDCWIDPECMDSAPLIPDPKDSPQRSDPTPNISSQPKKDMGPISRAVIRAARFPISGSYSDTRYDSLMVPLQMARLPREPAPHMAFFTLTQYWTDVVDVATEKHSIIYMARAAHKGLFDQLWPAMLKSKGAGMPNMILVDAIQDNQITGLVNALNAYFPRAQSRIRDHVVVKDDVRLREVRGLGHNGIFPVMKMAINKSGKVESLGSKIEQTPTEFAGGGFVLLAAYFMCCM